MTAMAVQTDTAPSRLLNRELSWLEFNARVLELAEDETEPLLERVKFCAIFSNNLDEFFMVRVAGLLEQDEAGYGVRSADGLTASEALHHIGHRVRELTQRQSRLWKRELRPALAKHGIDIGTIEECGEKELARLEQHFRREIYPVLTPLAVGPGQPFPYISGLSLSLGVTAVDPETGDERFARVKVPEGLDRFVDSGKRSVPLEAVIAHFLPMLFPGMEIVERAVNDWLGLPAAQGRVGLSPHAPYSTSTELLECSARAAHRRNWRLTTHVAESEQEFEMFMYRQGAMFDWLKSQRDMSDCGRGSPVQHLERCGYLDENLLAAHVNYLWRHDAGVLGRNGVSVVHCPRSHDYFRHLRFPREELHDAGVNLCLGTDSLVTVRKEREQPLELNLFAEMKTMAASSPELSPETILRMATTNGAQALGRKGDLGEFSLNALADLITIPFAGPEGEALEAIVHHEGEVMASMIGGVWVARSVAE